jgi:hypothetical protein
MSSSSGWARKVARMVGVTGLLAFGCGGGRGTLPSADTGTGDDLEQQIGLGRGGLPSPGANMAPGQFCDFLGWCWYNPLPAGVWWFAAGGAGREAWIAGNDEAMLHFDGRAWTVVPTPTSGVQALWAAAPDDVWFAAGVDDGSASTLHWDGQTLAPGNDGHQIGVSDLWGSSGADVYAVGSGGAMRYDGQSWTVIPNVAGQSVSGSGPRDVWVAASDGGWHFDGDAWTRIADLEGKYLLGFAAAGPDDVFAATLQDGDAQVLHFDGDSWTVSFDVGRNPNVALWGIGLAGRRDVWVVGTQFTPASVAHGYLLHYDGTRWTTLPEAPTSLTTVRTAGGRTLAVGMDGGILQLTGGTHPGWIDLRFGTNQELFGVWGSAPDDMWAVGGGGAALRSDGHVTSPVATGTQAALADVWGTGPADVWAVGAGGAALHLDDGGAFTAVPTGVAVNLNAVFTAAPGDAWAGGDAATLLHFTGGAFAPAVLPGADPAAQVLDIHGAAPDDVWLSGAGPTGAFVSHFDGTAWSPAQVLNQDSGGYPGHRIWELAPNDVWMLTQPVFRGQVQYWHFDGSAWSQVFTVPTPTQWMFPQPGQGHGSFVFSPTDRWVVGALGEWKRSTEAPVSGNI